jgi:CrcB protein
VKFALIAGGGGFLGSAARYLAGTWIQRALPNALVPYGTLTVNIVGCLVIGFLGGIARMRPVFTPEARVFVFIGVLGGFTTFSSFAYETLALAHDADYGRAAANVLLQFAGCLAAVWIGNILGRAM